MIACFLVGALSPYAVLRPPFALLERSIQSLPLAGGVYRTVKQISAPEDDNKKTGFTTVVRIEYPRRGAWAIGFLTGIVTDSDGRKHGVIYMPSTPLPHSGWLVQIPFDEIQLLDWSSGTAMQYIVSAGVVAPERMATTPLQEG